MTAPDDELERVYENALELEKSGRLDEAAAAWREVLRLDPDDCGGATIRLAALGEIPTPKVAPAAYVMTLFDQTAEAFDDILVRQLSYDVPNLIAQALREHAPGPYARMLDLGCGTGLCALAMEDLTRDRTGVDLSEDMIEKAAERDLYDDLYIGEIVAFLKDDNGEANWDLIVAADVLPYLGDVTDLFAATAARLNSGGTFAFSTETLHQDAFIEEPYLVNAGHRFAHDPFYLDDALEEAGMDSVFVADITVRTEDGEPVPGHLFLARKF
ncbi:class I SAM-dependent DNA methyltransferase [Tepidamorphus sp. 3E244]|uniref:class I SAM-dependent DNA methyltransferase n=1 Tax=Tepidamorphus sp. 3E244 TaxID=3385498 RepID=UPI0038FC24C3